MRTIEIHCSKKYTVTIGSGVIQQLSDILPKITKAEKVCIVSDHIVWSLYGKDFSTCLPDVKLFSYIFPAGEENKNTNNYFALLNFLAENDITRTDCIIALGGGVVGDLAGFAAATYRRGLPYIQIPTTLLAMVDSSVGGKTGIDLQAGKNLVGAFYQPAAVLCDTDFLHSLPLNIFRDGCAEVVKYAILYDPVLFSHLEEKGMEFDREWVISQCIEWKCKAVEQDEFDHGSRILLNLGHTIGHAIESISNYSTSHGRAVAMGIAIISRAVKCTDTDRIVTLMKRFDLPIFCDFSAKVLTKAAMQDKKRNGDQFHLIIPNAIGDCVVVPTNIGELEALIEKGL